MNKVIRLKIDNSLNGKTVKYILSEFLGISGAIITLLKKADDGIVLNGEKVFVNHKAQTGDELVISIYDENSDICSVQLPLDIIFEDEDIIILNKPRSMPTHPSRNHYDDTLANALMYYYRDEKFTFRAVTRLDRDTSGIVLVAKNPLSGAILSESMKKGEISKQYVAIIDGIPEKESGRINAPIKRLQESIITRGVAPDGKEAITDYEVIKKSDNISFVRLFPITGRTHQLRVHMSYIGTPICGDSLYGNAKKGEETLLHCERLSFIHPITKQEMTVEAPLPKDIKAALLV